MCAVEPFEYPGPSACTRYAYLIKSLNSSYEGLTILYEMLTLTLSSSSNSWLLVTKCLTTSVGCSVERHLVRLPYSPQRTRTITSSKSSGPETFTRLRTQLSSTQALARQSALKWQTVCNSKTKKSQKKFFVQVFIGGGWYIGRIEKRSSADAVL